MQDYEQSKVADAEVKPEAGQILLFDTVEGGAGFVDTLFARIEELLDRAADVVLVDCTCEFGCPKCLLSPRRRGDVTVRSACGGLKKRAGLEVLKVTLPSAYEDRQPVKDLVERLMARDPAHRFEFIQSRASAIEDDAIDA